jgi:MFS transporter, NNP family, nitrate/nitrite transporter
VTPSRRATANLALATVAFALCFTAWSLIAPFAKTFKHQLGLNYTEALLLTAIPVVLGSLLRVPPPTSSTAAATAPHRVAHA